MRGRPLASSRQTPNSTKPASKRSRIRKKRAPLPRSRSTRPAAPPRSASAKQRSRLVNAVSRPRSALNRSPTTASRPRSRPGTGWQSELKPWRRSPRGQPKTSWRTRAKSAARPPPSAARRIESRTWRTPRRRSDRPIARTGLPERKPRLRPPARSAAEWTGARTEASPGKAGESRRKRGSAPGAGTSRTSATGWGGNHRSGRRFQSRARWP